MTPMRATLTAVRQFLVGFLVASLGLVLIAQQTVLVGGTVTVTGTVNVGNGSTTDTDDGTIAGGQSTVALVAAVPYAFDGSNNVRLRAATAAPITGTVALATRPILPNPTTVEYLWTTAQTDDAVVTIAGGAVVVVTQIQCTVDQATTVGVAVRIGFGASTIPTAPTDGNAVAAIIARHAGMVPGSGISRGDGSGIVGIGADGEDLRITTGAATGGGASCVISYYSPVS